MTQDSGKGITPNKEGCEERADDDMGRNKPSKQKVESHRRRFAYNIIFDVSVILVLGLLSDNKFFLMFIFNIRHDTGPTESIYEIASTLIFYYELSCGEEG